MALPHIKARIFNRPHLIEPDYASVFIGALAERLDVDNLTLPDGETVAKAAMALAAADFEPGRAGQSLYHVVEGVAIIPVEGTLVHRFGHLNPYSGMTGYDGIHLKIEAAMSDPSIRGVVLDIDSPGGEVAGCFDLTDRIYELRSVKPIWSCVDETACSGAYAIASATHRIIAPRTALVGSVGVLMAHLDKSGAMQKTGLAVTLIHAGAHKVDGNPFQALPDDVRDRLQKSVDKDFKRFTETVARNRGMSVDAVVNTQALVYDGEDAKAVGFIDAVQPVGSVFESFDKALADGTATGKQSATAKPAAAIAAQPQTAARMAESFWEKHAEQENAGHVVVQL